MSFSLNRLIELGAILFVLICSINRSIASMLVYLVFRFYKSPAQAPRISCNPTADASWRRWITRELLVGFWYLDQLFMKHFCIPFSLRLFVCVIFYHQQMGTKVSHAVLLLNVLLQIIKIRYYNYIYSTDTINFWPCVALCGIVF